MGPTAGRGGLNSAPGAADLLKAETQHQGLAHVWMLGMPKGALRTCARTVACAAKEL